MKMTIHANCEFGFDFVLRLPQVFQVDAIYELPEDVRRVANSTHRFILVYHRQPTEEEIERLAKILGGRQYIKTGP